MRNTFHNPEELAHQVVLLFRQGMSRRAIARALGISRNTVRELLGKQERRRAEPSLAIANRSSRPRPWKLDAYQAQLQQLLHDYPEITAQRIFEELRQGGYDGGYSQVKERVRRLRPKPPPKVSLPVEKTGPGELAESDWSPYTIHFTTGLTCEVNAFSYALRFSHRKYYRFYTSVDLHATLDGHVQAFSVFGGVARVCKYDSQKPVVLHWEGHQPIYNPRFIDFATYYEFQPLACRRGHPNDKPTVERSFWELEQSFFNGRRFRDQADLAAQLEAWRQGICDVRLHKKDRQRPIDLFANEQPHLRPLPLHPYDTARVVYRLCDVEGFIAWDGNRYSLPYEHVTDFLPVRITQSELFVYAADLHLIARHELRTKGAGEDVTLPGHHPAASRRGPDLDQLRLAYDDIGPEATQFLVGLCAAQPRSAAHHARQILGLRERYKTADLLRALDHATRFGAFEHRAIERILRARAQPRALDEYVAEATEKKLEQILAQSRTEPRSLVEYDGLPPYRPQGEPPCQGRQGQAPPPPSSAPPDPSPTPTFSHDSESTSNDSD
jgi:transposase